MNLILSDCSEWRNMDLSEYVQIPFGCPFPACWTKISRHTVYLMPCLQQTYNFFRSVPFAAPDIILHLSNPPEQKHTRAFTGLKIIPACFVFAYDVIISPHGIIFSAVLRVSYLWNYAYPKNSSQSPFWTDNIWSCFKISVQLFSD